MAITQDYLFSFAKTLKRIAKACNSDPVCAAAHGDMNAKLRRAIARLRANPVVVPIENRKDGAPYHLKIDETVFLEILFDRISRAL